MPLPSMSPDGNTAESPDKPSGVLVFSANDPSGASGLAADIGAIASIGVHPLPVMTGAYARDTAQIFDFYALDDEAVGEQAQAVLEDIGVQAILLGFAGTPDNLGVVAGVAADYPDTPLIAYMPDLSWWQPDLIDGYHDAFAQLILPQAAVLVGNHSTLRRWLLPDWSGERPPGARDLAMAAGELGTHVTLVTGIARPERGIDNTLATPHALLATESVQSLDGSFAGAGETLSAAFAALLASDCELTEAFSEALSYLGGCLEAAYRPGMGHAVPDRLFWAQAAAEDATTASGTDYDSSSRLQELSPHDTQH